MTGTPRFLVSRNFALLWVAQATSSFGEFVLGTTVTVWLVLDLANGDPLLPTYIAAVVIAASAPRLLVAPFAGVWVDRWQAKRTMIGADVIRAALVAPVIVVAAITPGKELMIGSLLGLLVGISVLSQFFNPARAALMQVVIPASRRVDASSKSMFAGLGVAAIAAALGPTLFALYGAIPALAMTMLTFLVSAVVITQTRKLAAIPISDPEITSFWSRFRRGLATAWRVHSVRLVLIGVGLYGVSLGINNAVLALFALETLHLSAAQYGIVAAAFSVGGLIGAVLATPLLNKVGSERLFPAAIVLLGLSYFGYALTRDFWPASALMLLSGVIFAIYVVAQGPILQAATPPGFMGRITAVSVPILGLSSTLATVITSQLLAWASLRASAAGVTLDPQAYAVAIAVGAAVLCVGGAAMAVGSRRRLRESRP
ncbi:MFS transporter [Salinibacterium sp. SWN139]|uniref:MFS transporter n=1 Tax=Salinibacterium sp. SWN139 TaxID=2792055 RepID=UPI0018CDE915|nr:MFS transporter [Salinibacterium sp. SWN139]MBH0052888.1 MFS transporter [Salinibacterium sp. SWN139]